MKNDFKYQRVYNTYAKPMMFRSVINSLMHTADRMVAGMFIGVGALVATTIVSPVMYLIYAIAALFIGGLGAYVGLLIGRGKTEKASQVSTNVIIVLVSVGMFLTVVTISFNTPIIKFLGGQGDGLKMASDYLRVFALSFPLMLLGRGLDVLICNDGDPKYSMRLNLITTAFNFAVNVFAVAVLDMGVLGLAGATVISELIQVLGGSYYFLKKNKIIKLTLGRWDLKALLRICYNGISDFTMLLVDAVMIFVVNQAFVRFLAPEYFQGYAAANVLMVLFYGIFMGSIGGLQPILSQMMGQGKFTDIKALFNYSVRKTILLGIIMYIGFMPVAHGVLSLFITNEATLEIGKFFYGSMGFAILFSNLPLQSTLFFTAINRPIESAVISTIRTLILLPSLIYIGIKFMGPWGVGLGFLVADLFLVVVLIIYMKQLDLSKLKVYE